jgi:hypothetical protein
MRKFKLRVEDLSIESFQTGGNGSSAGTVQGQMMEAASMPEGTCVATCTTAYTGTPTCKWTCDDATCGMNCETGPNYPGCVTVVVLDE